MSGEDIIASEYLENPVTFFSFTCEIFSFYHQLSYHFFCGQKEECICYFTKTETINGELNFPLSITYYTERINFTLLRSYYKMSAYLIYLFC